MPKVASGQGEDFDTLQPLVLVAISIEITKTVKSHKIQKTQKMAQNFDIELKWTGLTE